jgi:nucleotide-binding universal stress UspA family protein
MIEIKKILFPLDLTENSSKILDYVLSLSEKYNSLVYLLHVVQHLRARAKITSHFQRPSISLSSVAKM